MEYNLEYIPVIVFAPSVLAGAEKVVITGTQALVDIGLKPHLIVIKETRLPHLAENFVKEFSPLVRITLIESTKAIDFKLVTKIKSILKKEEKKIILHTHGLKALVACRLLRMPIKHIHTHHGNTSHTFKMKIYEWIADMAMKKCDQVIAVSEEMKLQLQNKLSPYKKITVITNMLSLKNAHNIREYRASMKRKDDDFIHLIFIGRLAPEKGILPLLNNLKNYEEKSQFQLSVLGDGPEMEKARDFVLENHMMSQVRFYGFVPNPGEYLKDTDVLVLPSFTEGLPMTLIESLASGIPVIANNVGAIKSLIEHRKNGYLVANNNFENWKLAFLEVKKNRQSWQEYALDEAPAIEEKYSAHNWATKTKEIYENIISSSKT